MRYALGLALTLAAPSGIAFGSPAPPPTPAPTSTVQLAQQREDVSGQLASANQDLDSETAASREAAAALAAVRRELPAATAALAAAQLAVRQAQAKLAAENTAIAHTQKKIVELATERSAKQTLVAQRRAHLDSAVRATFIAGPQGLARSIATVQDPTAYIENAIALQRMGIDTNAAVNALDSAIADLDAATARADAAANQLQHERDDAALSVRQSAAATAQAAASAEHLQVLVHQRQAAAAAAQREVAAAAARINELQAESDRVSALIAQAQAAEAAAAARAAASQVAPAHIGAAGLLWPANGPVTSPFGYRTDPVTHQHALHAGVDIGAPEGAAIQAAQAGTVIYAGQEQGYGNYTCIDHSAIAPGLATCYAHQSAILVSVGQTVSRGQLIGRVGHTGYATGPHLHFETRIDGTPVDPMTYF